MCGNPHIPVAMPHTLYTIMRGPQNQSQSTAKRKIKIQKQNDISVFEPMVFLLSTTNKMQRYTISFITVIAVHVSGGFSAHRQELNNCIHSNWYVPRLLAATASGSSKQAWHIPNAVCTVLELLTMGGETVRNM